ncbi:mannosyltransferase putative-domain-containing protein [Aspergillus ambiguus]|uniref:mannosyltransferase putative-domain-containing protein n=1 Tax=Aspergillus ambiguus TaxID=176160 RepID=UPI003CCCE73E
MAQLAWMNHPRRPRSTFLKALFLILVILFCYRHAEPSSGISRFIRPVQPQDSSSTSAVLNNQVPVEGQGVGLQDEPHNRPSSAEDRRPDIVNTKSQHKIPQKNAQSLYTRPDHSTTDTSTTSALQDSLRHIISLLPDEMRIRDLLSPIEGTGETKIHEIGLRTRAYKVLFEAWEAIHLVPTQDGIYRRDDIIQFLKSHPEIANDLQTDTIKLIHIYEAFRSLVTQLSSLLFPWTAPYFADHIALHGSFYSGQRGLVFTGSDDQAPYMITSIKSIRKLGCDLPVEVMYLGDDDLSEDFRERLEAIPGVLTRDLSQMVLEEGWSLAGWAGKPFAILLSSFQEAMFVDADALFVRNPEVLFEDEAYTSEGALFFKDRLLMPESKKSWMQKILPRPISKKARDTRLWKGESAHMQESGVVVVDKWRHFVALMLVSRLNGPDRDGDKDKGKVGLYDMVYGDKETFWLGWELAGDLGYAFHSGSAALIGSTAAPNEHDAPSAEIAEQAARRLLGNKSMCGPQLLHLGRDDRPLWFNGWLQHNKFAKGEDAKPVDFKEYIREPSDVDDPNSWKLSSNNICCLRSESTEELTEDEKDALKMIIETAREVGALH